MRAGREKIENEALRLFEFGIDEEFHRHGKVVLDSSLGLMPPPHGRAGNARRRPAKKH